MKMSFEFTYQIGQEIFHKITGDKGIVTDIKFSALSNITSYIVTFGRFMDDEVECLAYELSEEKVLV